MILSIKAAVTLETFSGNFGLQWVALLFRKTIPSFFRVMPSSKMVDNFDQKTRVFPAF